MSLTQRRRRPVGGILSQRRELARAALNADFVALSPVLPTASHPGQPGIGWEKFGELIRDYPLPCTRSAA